MDAIFQFGILPFIGLCAGTGALAFIITRAVTPAKPCEMKLSADNEYAQWASQEGHYTHFKPGQRRLVHVSRGAIGGNMKNRLNYWPTAIVIDENGKKHEFHEVFTHAPGTLLFDAGGVTANVYFVTYGQISGRHLKGLPTEFAESVKMPETPNDALKQENERLTRRLRELEEENLTKNQQLELLRVTRSKKDSTVAVSEVTQGWERTCRIQKQMLKAALEEALKPKLVLPLSKNINLENQCRVEECSRQVKIGSGCGSYYETEYYDKVVSLKPGDEGYIDKDKQVRYVRVRNQQETIEAIPLQIGDLGYIEPKKPVSC